MREIENSTQNSKNLSWTVNLKLVAIGFVMGFLLCWWMSAIGRSMWDAVWPWGMMEFWISGLLLIVLVSLHFPDILLPSRNKKQSFVQICLLSMGLLSGSVLNFAWGIQSISKSIDVDHRYTLHRVNSLSSLLNVPSSSNSCQSSSSLISELISNHSWSMDSMEKMLVRDFAVKKFVQGCLSDDQLFSLVHRLRTHGSEKKIQSASFQWSFQPPSNEWAISQSLGVTRQEWCSLQFQQKTDDVQKVSASVALCQLIKNPQDIIDAPIDFSDITTPLLAHSSAPETQQ